MTDPSVRRRVVRQDGTSLRLSQRAERRGGRTIRFVIYLDKNSRAAPMALLVFPMGAWMIRMAKNLARCPCQRHFLTVEDNKSVARNNGCLRVQVSQQVKRQHQNYLMPLPGIWTDLNFSGDIDCKAPSSLCISKTQRDVEKYGRNNRATVSIHIAPCSAKGLRGHNNITVCLDEMAHFFEDEKSKGLITGSDHNDRSIYNAVTPSVARFKGAKDKKFYGKIICISSPSVKSGKFYEEYERSFKKDVNDLLMMQLPSWEMYPELSTEYLKGKFNENPMVFRAEHGAMFDDRLKGWIEDPSDVRQNIVPGLKYKDRTSERVPHFMGIDIGLKGDGTAICICHHVQEIIQGVREVMIEIDDAQVRYAEQENKAHFVPDELADWIASFCPKFYIIKGMLDQWYGMSIVPILQGKGLKQFEFRQFNENLNSTIYQNLLTHFLSRTLRMPELDRVQGKSDSDTALVAEILSLQSYQKSKYIIDVHAPDRAGAHDDLSDALSRAVLLASEYKSKGYGLSLGSAATGQGRVLRMSRSKELMRMNLNRPVRGGMTGRDMFSRAVQSSLTRTRY